jgi:hypothetical protein
MSKERDGEAPVPGDNRAFLAWLETVPDPERRYSLATSALEDYQQMVTKLAELRAAAVADASEEDSVASVARRFGVSRQRAYQLLQQAKGREGAVPKQGGRAVRQKGNKEL